MKITVTAKFNLIGVTAQEYEYNGNKGVKYGVKVDYPDGVEMVRIDENIYNTLKNVAPMTPILCQCAVNTSSQYENSRFVITGVQADKSK